jgi:hypothetical protein
MCGRNLITGLTSAASPRVDISNTCKVGQKIGASVPLLTCSTSAWPSRLLYRRGQKSRRELWITLYSLNAIGVTPGSCRTVHIYTQTIHRTTQTTQTIHRTTQHKTITMYNHIKLGEWVTEQVVVFTCVKMLLKTVLCFSYTYDMLFWHIFKIKHKVYITSVSATFQQRNTLGAPLKWIAKITGNIHHEKMAKLF